MHISLQHEIGTIPIVTTNEKKEIDANILIFDFELSAEEVEYINTFNTGERSAKMLDYQRSAKYPFNFVCE